MKVESVNNSKHQSFGRLVITPEAGKHIEKHAMNLANKATMIPFINSLKSAKAELENQKWGDVIVDLNKNAGITDNGFTSLKFITKLFAPVLCGISSINNRSICKTIEDYKGSIVKQYLLSSNRVIDDAFEEWDSIEEAVNIAKQHEEITSNKKEKINQKIKENNTYIQEMKKSLEELNITESSVPKETSDYDYNK